MVLEIENGVLFADNKRICLARAKVAPGYYEVSTSFSHKHNEVLPQIHNVGWIGEDVIVGTVKNHDIIPCKITLNRIVGMVTIMEDVGSRVTLVVKP
jgi:hypothetical protein